MLRLFQTCSNRIKPVQSRSYWFKLVQIWSVKYCQFCWHLETEKIFQFCFYSMIILQVTNNFKTSSLTCLLLCQVNDLRVVMMFVVIFHSTNYHYWGILSWNNATRIKSLSSLVKKHRKVNFVIFIRRFMSSNFALGAYVWVQRLKNLMI